MSEIKTTREYHEGFRWALLATVSIIALTGAACNAKAADSNTAPFWIELGGQLAQNQTDAEVFDPHFLSASPFEAASHVDLEKGPPSTWDGDAKIAFEPEGTGWVFSASILYGKGNRHGSVNQQTANPSPGYGLFQAYQKFEARSEASHTVLDFQAGKDIGLGMFGNAGHSVLSLGVRYAQFASSSNVSIQSQPTNQVVAFGSYHRFYATLAAKRKFTGVGPSLSLDSSAALFGNPSASSLTLDWGVNGALLFGRQRANVHHQTTNSRVVYRSPDHRTSFGSILVHIPVSRTNPSLNRSKEVIVPNLGGFAGVSWRYPNAKVSIGYRADFFFGAMDGGIDAVHRENLGFYGPFASVSVGIGG